jgi:outer membrane protein
MCPIATHSDILLRMSKLVGFAVLIFCFSFQSPTALSAQAYDLNQCFQAALGRSEVLASQQELVNQTEERIKQATGALLPTVAGFASRRWQETVQSATGGSFYPPIQDQAYINVSQPLFRGLREYATRSQAKGQNRAENEALHQAEITLYRDVSQAFFTVLSLERDLANLESQTALYGKRVGEIKDRIRIGRSRLSERLTVESAEAGLRAQIEATRGQIGVARELLAFQTGLAKDISLTDVTSGVGTPSAPGDTVASSGPNGKPAKQVKTSAWTPRKLEDYLARLEERPDVKTGKERVVAAEEGIPIARGGHLPSLDLGGNYYFTRPGVLADSHWDVTLALSVPIFSGGVVQSQVRTAASVQSQAELALARTRRLAEQEVRSFYETVQADLGQLKVLEQAAKISESNYNEQSREYRYGLVTNLDVLQALTAFQESQRALDRARFTFRNDQERLESAAAFRGVRSS